MHKNSKNSTVCTKKNTASVGALCFGVGLLAVAVLWVEPADNDPPTPGAGRRLPNTYPLSRGILKNREQQGVLESQYPLFK